MASEGPFFFYEHWVIETPSGGAITLRQAYDRYIVGSTKPSEEQFQWHYDAGKTAFMSEGYSEKEIKWWFLRTGQGPECFRQMKIGEACGLPPYEVWRDWYTKPYISPYGTNFGITGVDGTWDAYPLMGRYPIYPPPGYSMPGMPCNTEGKRLEEVASSDPNHIYNQTMGYLVWGGVYTWPFADLPPITGDPYSASFSLFGFGPPDMIGAGAGMAFCKDDADGILHPLPLAWTVFKPSDIQAGIRAAQMLGGGAAGIVVRGLPIGIMAMLDNLTSKQWADFMDPKIHEYLNVAQLGGYPNYQTSVHAWPYALRDTLNHFSITDPSLWAFQAKIQDIATKLQPRPRKRGVTILMGGGNFAMIAMMVVMAVCTAGIAMAATALITEAVVAAGIATAAEVATALETVQTIQTVYNVASEVLSGDPNLLALGSSLLSLNETFDVVDLDFDLGMGAGVDDIAAYDYSFDGLETVGLGGEQIAFDYSGDTLYSMDMTEGSDILGTMFNDAVSVAAPEYDFSNVDFSGSVAEQMDAAVAGIVENLDQYAGDPNALFAAIEDAAVGIVETETEFALAVIDETVAVDVDMMVDEALAINADVAATTDVGPLTVDQLDETMYEDGWSTAEQTGMDYEQASLEGVEEQVMAAEAVAELPVEEIQQVLEVAAQIAEVVAPAIIAPPPPPPPPPSPAQIVTAPAPPQPLPGPVATVTYPPEQAALIDAPQGIPLTTASLGPIASDGEKGFNLWWLLPLGLLAIPMNGKRRTGKRKRK